MADPVIDDIDDEDDDEGMDPIEYLGAFLHTDEGETITQVIAKLSTQLEMQNKILIKIFGAISALKPASTA